MADDVTRDLVVALQSISYSGTTSVTLLSTPIDIFIDSTDPNIWLPADTCDAFEKAFGLTLDSKSGLYLINDTHHNALLDSNAEVTFRLSDVKSGGDSVAIVLPYAAFGLTAEYPLVENSSHYFPLKRANSSTQYTLGRTFLQEGYASLAPRARHHHFFVRSTADTGQLSHGRLRTQGVQRLGLRLEPRRPRKHNNHHIQGLVLQHNHWIVVIFGGVTTKRRSHSWDRDRLCAGPPSRRRGSHFLHPP